MLQGFFVRADVFHMYPVRLHLEGKNLENSVQQLHPTFLHWPPLEGPVYSVLPCTPSSHSEAKCNLLFISSVTSISGPRLLLLFCSQTHLTGLLCLASILNFLPADCFLAMISVAVSSLSHTHGVSACGLMPPSMPAHLRRAPNRPPSLCHVLSARLGT